jgi:hypothetical protein
MSMAKLPQHLPSLYDTTTAELRDRLSDNNLGVWIYDEATIPVPPKPPQRTRMTSDFRFTTLATSLHVATAHGQVCLLPFSHAAKTAGWVCMFTGDMRSGIAMPATLAYDNKDGPVAFPTIVFPTVAAAVALGVAHEADFVNPDIRPQDNMQWRFGDPVWRRPVEQVPVISAKAATKKAA